MFGLGLVTSMLSSSGPSKEEKREAAEKAKDTKDQREMAERETDDRKREYANESGTETNDPGKENKPSQPKVEDDGLMSKEHFITLEKRRIKRIEELEANEVTGDGHKRHVARRWAVRIWNTQIDSLIKEEGMVFININWGGDREEARIRTGEGDRWWQFLSDSEVVWGMGSEPHCLRTDVMPMAEKGRVIFQNEFSFEWRGSYAELETQFMTIELWRWNKFRANTIDSHHKASLASYASGPVFQELSLTKANTVQTETGAVMDDKDAIARFRATLQIYFQELFDFELNVIDVQAFGLMSEGQLMKAQAEDFAKASKILAGGSSGMDDDEAVVSIYDASDSSDESDEEPTSSASVNAKKRASSSAALTPGFRRAGKALRHQSTAALVAKTRASKLKRRVVLFIRNPTFTYKLRRGVMEARSDLKRAEHVTNLDRWGNIGKIHYRGTLADLDNDLLYLQFYESTILSPVPTVIGTAAVSLRGVHEYGNISGGCSPPDWVISRAKAGSGFSDQEIKLLKKSTVGRFEAKISVDNLPKFKQSGELCDMISDKAYLLVKVLRVDRVAIPDQRPISQCDSAVQVQFSGNSYETEVRQDTIAPQFNQEFYFELKTNTPSEFSPEELSAMHGPIIFDVWLRSDDEGALTAEHCGHVEISLMEIFSEGKAEMKTHNSIRTGEVTEYRTAVLKARRRLTCLWTNHDGTRPSINVPTSALAPSFLYVDVWLRPFDFTAFSLQARGAAPPRSLENEASSQYAGKDPLLPARVRYEWNSRVRAWDAKAEEVRRRIYGLNSRGFDFVARSQNRDEHFLPTFLDVIRPPESISNPRAIAFWIHCLAHTSMADLKAAVRFWSTPDFTLSLGKGDTFAHALLHCSMLRGLPAGRAVHPFVCVGTGWDNEPLAWVMTMNPSGSVTFWDTAGHQTIELPRRCADADRCRRVALGKRPASQCVTKELMGLEVRRRQRLEKQDMDIQKLKKFELDMLNCDPTILRAPELLKLKDPDTHPHALVYTTDIPADGQCYRCGLPPDRRVLHGYVCNQRLVTKSASNFSESSCLSNNGAFLCLRCADRMYTDEPTLPTDDDGNYTAADLQPCKFSEQPILPYKTIDVVFDSTNCWLNLQHFSPAVVLYDLWNPMYWHPFTSLVTSFRAFSVASKGLRKAKSKEYFDHIRSRILGKLKKSMESVRRNGNLSTYFQRDALLMQHMEKGLELTFKRELADNVDASGFLSAETLSLDAEINEWKLELYSKVPANHRLTGHTFLFSFTDSIEISRIVLERINFLYLKEPGTQFVVSSFIGKLPNSVKAAYVYVGIVHPLSEGTLQQISELRTQDAFQTNGTTNALTDEVIERNRMFIQRMQIFENDTEFVSKMRAELYNKELRAGAVPAGGVVNINKGTNSKAPSDAKSFVRSQVDFGSTVDGVLGMSDSSGRQEERHPLLSRQMSEQVETVRPPAVGVGGYFSGIGQSVESAGSTVYSGMSTDQAAKMAANAATYVTGLFGAPGQLERPAENRPMRPMPVKPPKDLSRKGPVNTPLPLDSPLNPTDAELREIYRPVRVEKVVGERQYLRHVPTGYTIPLPAQAPLQRVIEMGAEDLTTHVHVTAAHVSNVVTRVEPPREAAYEFNMRADARNRPPSDSSRN